MTMEKCYQLLGGNYTEVSTRLPSTRLVKRFVGKFLGDKSFEMLCAALETGNRKESFHAALR